MKRPREQSVLRQKLSVLLPPTHRPLHMPRATGSFPKLSVVRRDYVQEVKPEERDYYNTCIVCKSANELCVLTAGQSNCPRQHKECKVRVSSTSAHNILRTRRGPQAILRSLLNNFFSSVATAYGMHMEPVAREEFEKQHGITATEPFALSLTSGAVDDEPLPLPICISAPRQARLRPKMTTGQSLQHH
ncbi:hypothetical protein HPB50_028643 [Hyalomma asiaticum]|nr:hypothetical protein HPB50_028643 [Hyalomma asiaticum]